jgi:asparagine synthase (glutamine-hydrolysing)
VHEHDFRVVLTGEGADELFAGYNIFREAKVRRFWARHPESECRPRLLGRLYPYLARDLSRGAAFTTAFFRGDLEHLDDPLFSHRIRFQNSRRLLSLLSQGCLSDFGGSEVLEERLLAELPENFPGFSALNRAQWLETRTFLQGYLLHAQGDRMLMGHAVEGRFPYLDHRLLELAARVPDRILLTGLKEKSLLRKAVAPLVPPEIVARNKQPYRAPISQTLVGPNTPEFVRDCFEPEAIARTGVLDASVAARVIAKCRRSLARGVAETDEMALVTILSTVLLHRQFVDSPALKAPSEPVREVQGDTVCGAEEGRLP